MDKRNVQDFTRDYITSFNDFLKPGLKNIIKNLRPTEFELGTKEKVKIVVENIVIRKPKCTVDINRNLYPWECRRSGSTYEGKVMINLSVSINNSAPMTLTESIGTVPIMVRSNLCHLNGLLEKDLIKHNEEDDELGGYFIVKGNQVMLRYLVQTRRHFPVVAFKPFQSVGTDRTGHQIYMRCVRDDDVTSEMKIFWRNNTCPDLQLQIGKKYFQIPIPIILRALQNKTVVAMFEDFPKTKDDFSLVENLIMMFNKFTTAEKQFSTNISCLEFLGSKFREFLKIPVWKSNLEAGQRFVEDFIAIHLTDYKEKYDLLISMIIKLHSFVNDHCCAESTDTLNFQEILTSGSLYQQVFRLTLVNYLGNLDRYISIILNKHSNKSIYDIIKSAFKDGKRVLNPVHYLLSTGSLGSFIVPGVKQNNGLRIMTDNINFYRFAANFRAFHRGAFFTTMKSSSIRRLLPESWGFVCPVHTPDGTPCGLLNHMTVNTCVQSSGADKLENENLENLLKKFIINTEQFKLFTDTDKFICVMLNGKLLGYIRDKEAIKLGNLIRLKKVFPDSSFCIPRVTEIIVKNISSTAAQFPGIYVFTTPGRFLRPVYNVMFGQPVIEYIGTFEQTYLDISCLGGPIEDGGDVDISVTHQELSLESIYSYTAGFTPYQNYNPSPRNLYQCQMSKQSMGFTYYTTQFRADTKMYCFLTPQAPLTRSRTYDEFGMKKRPLGYNPIVAVTSYTGYDMEDAMVINVNSLQRGMGRCAIYKNYVIDLTPDNRKDEERVLGYLNSPVEGLDSDGLPFVGQILHPDGKSALYASYDVHTNHVNITKYKEHEIGYVISVSLNGSRSCATICVKLQRNTDIGDKFSSRHGQKGVNSLKLGMVDLPVSEEGMVPDQLFNPHSFPSRMTIGMMMEFLSGKLAALSAKVIDSTAFQTDIDKVYMQGLTSYHYDAFGHERFTDGYRGRLMDSEITMGIVYYQRLRHLVEDKFQVRTVGKIDNITRQPVKGRKVGGGIRLGEMERDCLLSHGAVFSLQDRIIDCNSDKALVNYCPNCNNFIHSYYRPVKENVSWLSEGDKARTINSWRCKLCESDVFTTNNNNINNLNNYNNDNQEMMRVQVPAITRHLFHELTVMNVRAVINVKKIDEEMF